MIGKLKKDDNRFVVEYETSFYNNHSVKILPIHPDDLNIVDNEYNNHCIEFKVYPIIYVKIDEILSPDGITYYEVARIIQNDKTDDSWEKIYERYKRNKEKKSFYNWVKIKYITPNKK